jgi:hypothetical protein
MEESVSERGTGVFGVNTIQDADPLGDDDERLALISSEISRLKEQRTRQPGTPSHAGLQRTIPRQDRRAILDGSGIHKRSIEIEACRLLAPNSVFVAGFGRSSTTIISHLVNSSRGALVLNEANFYIDRDNNRSRFVDLYNQQHFSFGNQASKVTCIPDFLPDDNHTWWEWLLVASCYYKTLGDKMAFGPYHFDTVDPHRIRAFFEARFFDARYIFTIRDPISTMLSNARLAGFTDNYEMKRYIVAWLKYVQLWADWVRIFPNTLTLMAEELDAQVVTKIENFTGLSLSGAEKLLDREEQRTYKERDKFTTLVDVADELTAIFHFVKQALKDDRVLWQADQKLGPGRAWAMSKNLFDRLQTS